MSARRGWSTSNYLSLASGIATAVPMTLACWAKTSITGATQTMIGLHNTTGATNRNMFALQTNTASQTVIAQAGSSTAQAPAVSGGTYTTGVWFHACAVYASITSRTAYLNGTAGSANTTSITPPGINSVCVGISLGTVSGNAWAPAGTGDLAECAIWTVALGQADITALAKGLPAYLVKPANLLAYWPIVGTSPEINLKSNTNVLTMTGSLSQVTGPAIYYGYDPFSYVGSSTVSTTSVITAGAFALTGKTVLAPVTRRGAIITKGAYTYTGKTVLAPLTRRGAITKGAFTLAGKTVGSIHSAFARITKGTFTLSGKAINGTRSYTKQFLKGTYALTGKAINGLRTVHPAFSKGTFTLTGKSVSTVYAKIAQVLAGAFTLAGKAVSTRASLTAAVAAAAFVFAGKSILGTIPARTAQVAAGVFTVAGRAISSFASLRARLLSGEFIVRRGWHSVRLDTTANSTNRRVNNKWWLRLLRGSN